MGGITAFHYNPGWSVKCSRGGVCDLGSHRGARRPAAAQRRGWCRARPLSTRPCRPVSRTAAAPQKPWPEGTPEAGSEAATQHQEGETPLKNPTKQIIKLKHRHDKNRDTTEKSWLTESAAYCKSKIAFSAITCSMWSKWEVFIVHRDSAHGNGLGCPHLLYKVKAYLLHKTVVLSVCARNITAMWPLT